MGSSEISSQRGQFVWDPGTGEGQHQGHCMDPEQSCWAVPGRRGPPGLLQACCRHRAGDEEGEGQGKTLLPGQVLGRESKVSPQDTRQGWEKKGRAETERDRRWRQRGDRQEEDNAHGGAARRSPPVTRPRGPTPAPKGRMAPTTMTPTSQVCGKTKAPVGKPPEVL